MDLHGGERLLDAFREAELMCRAGKTNGAASERADRPSRNQNARLLVTGMGEGRHLYCNNPAMRGLDSRYDGGTGRLANVDAGSKTQCRRQRECNAAALEVCLGGATSSRCSTLPNGERRGIGVMWRLGLDLPSDGLVSCFTLAILVEETALSERMENVSDIAAGEALQEQPSITISDQQAGILVASALAVSRNWAAAYKPASAWFPV
jgi:hypothetical protein